jgi:hypothetical protein
VSSGIERTLHTAYHGINISCYLGISWKKSLNLSIETKYRSAVDNEDTFLHHEDKHQYQN